MRAAFLALMAIGTLWAIDIAPAQAQYYRYQHDYGYPFCMRTRYDSDECNFYTYQQCLMTASGLGATCFSNPAFAYAEPAYIDQPGPRHHRHHRRHQYD